MKGVKFMSDEKKYKIQVRTLRNIILTFTVDDYEIRDGAVFFIDRVTNETKIFAISNCEIQEVVR
jgi:hypothetical protein